MLYVNSDLQAVEYKPDSDFPEQIWCQIKDPDNSNKFFVGVCYRTPTDNIFNIDTHSALRELLCKLGSSNKHFMLMGDFNYAFPCWPPHQDTDGLNNSAKEFCNCLDDNFLVQHVTTPTRKDNILDLVITDEPDMITDVTVIGALGTSDHHALQWAVQVKTVSNVTTRQVYDYSRADTCRIKTELAKVDWKELFSGMSVEDCWNLFKNTLQQLESTYVPTKTTKCNTRKPMWLSHKALKAVKHRHKIFQKYKNPAHPACKKANSQASKAVHQSRQLFERKLGSKIKEDKVFFCIRQEQS